MAIAREPRRSRVEVLGARAPVRARPRALPDGERALPVRTLTRTHAQVAHVEYYEMKQARQFTDDTILELEEAVVAAQVHHPPLAERLATYGREGKGRGAEVWHGLASVSCCLTV